MSIDRYQMALEIIAMSQYTEEGSIARLALRGPALRVAERPVAAALPEPDCEPEPEPASQIPPMVHNGRPYVPIVVPEPEPEDEPEAIDLDEIDAELDAEEAELPELPAVGRDGLTATQARALDLIREVGAISPGALSARLSISAEVRKRAIRALVERNLIRVTGTTNTTMYHRDVLAVADAANKPTMPAEPPAPENGAGGDRAVLTRQPPVALPDPDSKRRQEPPVEGRVLAEVRFKPGTISTVAKKLSLPVDDVAVAIRKLEREGEVKASVASGAVVWSRA